MAQPSPPTAAPGRVVTGGATSYLTDTYIYLSVHQALHRKDGENILWTTDINAELPVKVTKSGISAAAPVTLVEAFAEIVRKHSRKPALAFKPPGLKCDKFKVFNWQEYWNCACQFGKSLIKSGHQPRDRIIIMGVGSAFWSIAHFGVIFANGVSGSCYATNGVEATEFIINQSGCLVAVVDTVENMEKVLAAKKSGRCPNIKHIVMYLDDPPDATACVWRWDDFMRLGSSVDDSVLAARMENQSPGMCCELVYTSGTTGTPKAVMLSHDNLIWTTFSLLQGIEAVFSQSATNNSSVADTFLSLFGQSPFRPRVQPHSVALDPLSIDSSLVLAPSHTNSLNQLSVSTWFVKDTSSSVLFANMEHFTPDERVVSFLPLSHIASQIIDLYIPILSGCCVYFAQPDALRGSLIVTLHEVRPTFLFAVPRVYEKMEERIRAVGLTSTGLKKSFSTWVKEVGFAGTMKELNGERPSLMYTLVKSLILKRIQSALGLDQCKAVASGAAPLQPSTQDYFLSLGIPICNMYGMSESCGPQTSNAAWAGWYKRQTAGVSLPGTEIFIDHPNDDGDGEVCFRGRNVFMGYYGNREATVETIDMNGFLHSGDLGHVDNEGFLRITGRLKELLITAGGENVAPAPIEDRVKEEMFFISNCLVIGDKKNFLDPGLAQLLKERKSTACTIYEASHDDIMKRIIQEGLDRVNKRAISRAQHISRFVIIPQDFTQEGGELTATLKVKRQAVLEKYSLMVDLIYGAAEDDKQINSKL